MKTLEMKIVEIILTVLGVIALAGVCISKHMPLGFYLIASVGIVYECVIICIAIKYAIPLYPKRAKVLVLDVLVIMCLVAMIVLSALKGVLLSTEVACWIVTGLAMIDAINAKNFMFSLLRSRN